MFKLNKVMEESSRQEPSEETVTYIGEGDVKIEINMTTFNRTFLPAPYPAPYRLPISLKYFGLYMRYIEYYLDHKETMFEKPDESSYKKKLGDIMSDCDLFEEFIDEEASSLIEKIALVIDMINQYSTICVVNPKTDNFMRKLTYILSYYLSKFRLSNQPGELSKISKYYSKPKE